MDTKDALREVQRRLQVVADSYRSDAKALRAMKEHSEIQGTWDHHEVYEELAKAFDKAQRVVDAVAQIK